MDKSFEEKSSWDEIAAYIVELMLEKRRLEKRRLEKELADSEKWREYWYKESERRGRELEHLQILREKDRMGKNGGGQADPV